MSQRCQLRVNPSRKSRGKSRFLPTNLLDRTLLPSIYAEPKTPTYSTFSWISSHEICLPCFMAGPGCINCLIGFWHGATRKHSCTPDETHASCMYTRPPFYERKFIRLDLSATEKEYIQSKRDKRGTFEFSDLRM